MSQDRSITFTGPWGRKSWHVNYDGPYNNNRPPHVEVQGFTPDVGRAYKLRDLRAISSKALAWTVEGAYNSGREAHFTVYFGDNPGGDLTQFL